MSPAGSSTFRPKDDTDFNEYAFEVGRGEASPGLEDGMVGMRKGGLRRIELSSTMVFTAKKEGEIPLPTTKDGKRRFEHWFKTDDLLFIRAKRYGIPVEIFHSLPNDKVSESSFKNLKSPRGITMMSVFFSREEYRINNIMTLHEHNRHGA